MTNDEQRALIQEIATAEFFSESLALFNVTKEMLGDCKFIFAADNGPLPGLSVGRDFENGSAVRSLFSTERVLVLDKETLNEMSKGTAKFQIDYSISLDTQALSYLEPYIIGNSSKLPKDFKEIFSFISQGNVFVDPLPYIHENYQNLTNEKSAERIFSKLKAYEVLRNLDIGELENKSIVKASISEEELMSITQQQISRMYRDLDNAPYMKELDISFNYQYAHLLKMICIQLENPKKSRYQKISEFLDFCHFDVSAIGFREIFIACEFFEKGQKLGFFSKIQKNKKDLFQIVKGMAWDLYHIRQMERASTMRPDQRARYFFPSFLTCDKRLVEVLDLYPLKCLAYIEGAYEPMPFFNRDIVGTLTKTDIEKDEILNKYFIESKVNYRSKNRDKARNSFSALVHNLEYELSKVANVSF